VLIVFALNRLIDPRPIKSIHSWYEKTYLIKLLQKNIYPKLISNVLGMVGLTWKSQTEFFESLKKDGERILYDGSVIFSTSKENPLTETGYNKEHLLLTKINIVLAFSHDRFIPIFFRTIPGSIHEITTINILLEELGKDIILILDKGFYSHKVYKKIIKVVDFISPLRRDDAMIKYSKKLDSYFIYRDRPIKYASYKQKSFYVYLYEDLDLTKEEEKTYYVLKSKGKQVEFKEEWAGKIAVVSNKKFDPEEVYMMWKSRDKIEKVFDVLQNFLDTDRPWVRKEEVFRGYLFGSFLALIIYYLLLNKLKKAQINNKISVADFLLEFSKVYKIEIGKKEMMTEVSKTVRELLKKLKIKSIITK
jgi:transposase